MPEKFNAARRVRNILSTARAQNEHGNTLSAWGTTFQILDVPNYQFETFRLLKLLMEQVDNLAREVEGFGLDVSDYHLTFNNLKSILMVTNLDNPWQVYKRSITDEVIRQLGLFAQWSQTDEPVVPVEDMELLKQDLLNFQDEVMRSDLDERLKALVSKQINIILRALREYPIRGAEAIKDGDADFLGTIVSEYEFVREHKEAEVVQKTISFRERMRELVSWMNFGINLSRWVTSGEAQKMLEAGSDVIDKLP
jgi:hypothetical protein